MSDLIQQKVVELANNDLKALETFTDVKTFLQLIIDRMEANGKTSHDWYKIAKKLEVDVRAVEVTHADCLRKLSKYIEELDKMG